MPNLTDVVEPSAESVNFIPDSFAVMAYVQMHRATKQDEWAMLAKQAYATLLQRRADVRNEQVEYAWWHSASSAI